MGRPKLYENRKEFLKAYREKNHEHLGRMARIYQQRHRDKNRTDRSRLFIENRELLKDEKRHCSKCSEIKPIVEYYKGRSSCKCCDKKRYSHKVRWKISPEAKKLHNCISTHIRISLKGSKRKQKWETLIGYTVKDLMCHLEKLFKPGMTWSNQGKGWHIDHIIPVSAFNFTCPTDLDFKRCWALSNLQPLWGRENIIKKAKLTKPFQPALALAV